MYHRRVSERCSCLPRSMSVHDRPICPLYVIIFLTSLFVVFLLLFFLYCFFGSIIVFLSFFFAILIGLIIDIVLDNAFLRGFVKNTVSLVRRWTIPSMVHVGRLHEVPLRQLLLISIGFCRGIGHADQCDISAVRFHRV